MGKKGEGGEQTNPLAVVLYVRKRGNKVKTLRNPLTKESGNGVTNITRFNVFRSLPLPLASIKFTFLDSCLMNR